MPDKEEEYTEEEDTERGRGRNTSSFSEGESARIPSGL